MNLNKQNNIDLAGLSLEKLTEIVNELGEKKFRAKQVYEWIHKHNVRSYKEMTNVPKGLREQLEERFPFKEFNLDRTLEDSDRTKKFLWKLADESKVESVLIPDKKEKLRFTACISTQAGCPVGCIFCATGQSGFSRNLESEEIVRQVIGMEKQENVKFNNVVVMGQGEPFLNFDNTIKAIERINEDEGLNIAARKITVSTCGIIDGIEKFSKVPKQFGLAISLHSADQDTRNVLIPKMKNMPLESLREALKRYQDFTNRRITFEYMLIDNINDSYQDLEKLANYCKGILCHVNLLTLNPINTNVDGIKNLPILKPSSQKRMKDFEDGLISEGIPVSTRKSRGKNIAAACGQLAGGK